MLSLFRGASSAELEPEGVRLTVHNGTGVPRQGASSAEALRAAGFIANVAGDEPGGGAEGTVVRHPPGQEAAADLVARWLVSGARVEVDETVTGIELVTGEDWQGVRDAASPPTSTTTAPTLPDPGAGPAAPAGPDGGSDAAGRTTTSADLATLDC